jgi:hypothetical protein
MKTACLPPVFYTISEEPQFVNAHLCKMLKKNRKNHFESPIKSQFAEEKRPKQY